MADNSAIEWTDHSFNPWRGCAKDAADLVNRWGGDFYGERVIAAESYWKQPLKWNRQAEAEGVRKKVFCASLSDVFEGRSTMPRYAWDSVDAARIRLFKLIEATPSLDWLLLTKRPENVRPWLGLTNDVALGVPGSRSLSLNVWIGTTVENQEYANKRIPELLKIPAAVRFLSVEPMLGPIDLSGFLPNSQGWKPYVECRHGYDACPMCDANPKTLVDWVICGGESGPKARPMHPDWARSLRDQCNAAGVPFFFKQHGEFLPFDAWKQPDFKRLKKEVVLIQGNGIVHRNQTWHQARSVAGYTEALIKMGKKAAGRLLDGRTWDEMPEVSK